MITRSVSEMNPSSNTTTRVWPNRLLRARLVPTSSKGSGETGVSGIGCRALMREIALEVRATPGAETLLLSESTWYATVVFAAEVL